MNFTKTGLYTKLKWLKQPEIPPKPLTAPQETPPGWLNPKSAKALLNTSLRQRLMRIIWQRTSLSGALFASLYQAPVARFAELVQYLPASEYHHHSHPGGLLDHTLEVMAFAAKLRQRHLLPAGAAPEDQAREAEAWTAGIIYAALLHDVGKIATDMAVVTDDSQHWYPWQGPLTRPYRLRYHKNRNHALHPVTASLLATQILPATALNWLAQYRELYEAFLFCISGHYERAGILGELVQEADRASVAQFMGANASSALDRPQPSLPKQILTALQTLVQTEFKLSNPDSGSDGWLTQDALWLISKTTADRIRAWLLQQGITGVPDSNTRLYDEMQAHGLLLPTPEGKAVWTCEIAADSGWAPGRPLTLLCLAPARLWTTSGNRPAPFAGKVTPVSVASEPDGGTEIVQSGDMPLSQSQAKGENALTNLAFSLFVSEENNASHHPEQPVVTKTENETTLIPLKPAALTEVPGNNHSHRKVADGHPFAEETPSLPDADFIVWLREGIRTHKIAVNDTLARVHRVEGKAFLVSPEIFKLYIKTTSGKTGDEWKLAQKAFQKLKLHLRGGDGVNIFTCEVKGPRKTRRVKGYLLERPEEIFGNAVPEDNPYLSVIES